MAENPYLKDGRLADVIAAITTLGNYRYYKLSFETAAKRIANRPEDASKWAAIFREHPEFFRISEEDQKVSLVWRRQNPKRYHTKSLTEISRAEFDALDKDAKDRISRKPLEPSEISALINVAINLNERALEKNKAAKWWVPILSAVLGFIGALVGAYIGK